MFKKYFFIYFLLFIKIFADAHPATKFRSKNEPVIPAPDGTIFCEAEEFKVEKGLWQAKNWGENYFAATFANTFLSRKAFLSAPEQCDESIASINARIDKEGDYLVLARYEALYRFETQFRIKIEQDKKILMDRIYGARENLKIWAFGQKLKNEVAWDWGAVENIVWEGHDALVHLKPGIVKISLIAGKQPEPAAKRNVDIIMLTTDIEQVKMRIEKESYLPLDGWLTQAGDVWMKVRNTGNEKLNIKGGNFQEHSPYWVHLRKWKGIDISVEPGQTTDWIEVGSTMDTLNDGQWRFSVSGKCEIEFGVMDASGTIEKIRQFSLNNPGKLELIGFADTRYCKKIGVPDEEINELVDYLKKIKTYGKTPEKTLIFAVTGIKEFPSLFGFSSDPEVYVDWRGKTPEQLETICKNLTEEQRKKIRVVSLGDEIALPTPNPKEAKEGFINYLKGQLVKPEDIDATGNWDNISYNPDPKIKDTNPALYYWSKKYQHYYGIQTIKKLTDVLRKYLPNAGIGANFSPHHGGYAHSYLGKVFQWVSCFREDGLTMPWAEDYIWQVPVGSPQMNEINLDLFRAGIRGKPDRKIHYYVMPHWPGNTPKMWKRQFYAALAHGMKIINLFEFYPVYIAYTENHVSSRDMYEMVLRSFREYGLFEDIIQEGIVKKADCGLWFSETADIWDDNNGSFAAAKRALYIMIRNNQIPLDFVIEQDALDGTINQYKTIFITDKHISLSASKKISEWVNNGGTLFLTAGAGMFDEYNRKNNVIKELTGFEQKIIEGDEIHYIKQDLPFAKPVDLITEIEGIKVSIPVFGVKAEINPSSSGEIIGKFSDGKIALLSIPKGKGKIIYCAFLPGLSYFKPAIPLKPVDRGSTDDAMAHFLPVNFEPELRKLIKMSYSDRPLTFVRIDGKEAGFIETMVIESKNGMVIPVINWSPDENLDITVEIYMDLSNKKIMLASGENLKINNLKEKTELNFKIDVADAIIIR
jgi:hypothetical protein